MGAKACSIKNYFKKNRGFFVVFVVLLYVCFVRVYHTVTKSLNFFI